MNDKAKGKGDKLAGGKKNADDKLAKDKKGGMPAGKCPENRWLKVKWDRKDVYCADKAFLDGSAAGIKKTVDANATVTVKDQNVAGLKGKGQNSFKMEWKACGVSFSTDPKTKKMPDKLPAIGNLSADGLNAKTPKALEVKRLPDKALESVSFARSSPKKVNGYLDYAWTASFKLGADKATIKVDQTLTRRH